MTEEQQQELIQLMKDFQELLKNNYLQCCPCCGTFFNDDFKEKRKELLRRVDAFFAPEEEKWRYYAWP